MELGKFKPFEIGENQIKISHLQFADDTILLGEPSFDNLWALKTIFRSFELVSGLKVNFHKSSIMGLNVQDEFMYVASEFLNFKVGTIPFSYFGLPVDANPKKAATCEPIIEKFKTRLYNQYGGKIYRG